MKSSEIVSLWFLSEILGVYMPDSCNCWIQYIQKKKKKTEAGVLRVDLKELVLTQSAVLRVNWYTEQACWIYNVLYIDPGI